MILGAWSVRLRRARALASYSPSVEDGPLTSIADAAHLLQSRRSGDGAGAVVQPGEYRTNATDLPVA